MLLLNCALKLVEEIILIQLKEVNLIWGCLKSM